MGWAAPLRSVGINWGAAGLHRTASTTGFNGEAARSLLRKTVKHIYLHRVTRWAVGCACALVAFNIIPLNSGCNSTGGVTVVDDPGGVGSTGGDGGDGGEGTGTTPDPATGSDPMGSDPGSMDGAGDGSTGQARPITVTVEARVRNESSVSADVTIRFLADDAVIHLAFVRVRPGTVTSVLGPGTTEVIELTGATASGEVLEPKSALFGIDFDETMAVEYVIVDESIIVPPLPMPVDIILLEPAEDTVVVLGSSLQVRWSDEGGSSEASVRIFLEPINGGAAADRIAIGPIVAADLDGLNDSLTIALAGLETGLYSVVAEITDGFTTASDAAPGLVEIIRDPVNVVPTLSILEPMTAVDIQRSEPLLIRWTDADPDDNALITFKLSAIDPAIVDPGSFSLVPSIREDPDGLDADSATFSVQEVLPGLYELTGKIADEVSESTDVAAGIVRILPQPANVGPTLEIIDPAEDTEVALAGSVRVTWTDGDPDDNARIAFLFDPDDEPGLLNGNEILLATAIEEDDDGAGDSMTLLVPPWVSPGIYLVVGVISDGVVQVVDWSVGHVYLGVSIPLPPLPSVRFLAPSMDVQMRLGESFDYELETENVPVGASLKLFLTNVPQGGTTRVDITPASVAVGELATLMLETTPESIPNLAWPREFTFEVQLTTDNRVVTAEAPGHVWVRQEVEVLSVLMLNYLCTGAITPVVDTDRPTGVEITWYGGGFKEREQRTLVDFWLVGDGGLTVDRTEDSLHRIVLTTAESPGQMRVSTIEIATIAGFPGRIDPELNPVFDAGTYQVITELIHAQWGTITTPPHPDAIELCFPVLAP